MAEGAESSQGNPLSGDYELFQMYMNALDTVLSTPDVRSSFAEYGLSAGNLRMNMVHNAERVLRTAAREFAAYQDAVASELSARAAYRTMAPQGSRWSLAGRLWTPIHRFLSTDFGELLLAGSLGWNVGPEVEGARGRLVTAITETELLAQVRTYINTARQGRFGHAYSVATSPALSEVYDSINKISTKIEAELAGLLERLDGASIGVAGPRGAGKSTLIRGYCEEAVSSTDDLKAIDRSAFLGSGLPERSWGDLRCMLAAPVDYVAQDFVLHLFATFCETVISSYSKAGKFRGLFMTAFWLRRIVQLSISFVWEAAAFGGYAAILLFLSKTIAKNTMIPAVRLQYAGIAIIVLITIDFARSAAAKLREWAYEARRARGNVKSMVAAAGKYLSQVRYLQTYTSGLSGGLSLPNGANAQLSRSVSRAEQPLTYPEIVSRFRSFATTVAADVDRRGDRVFIGVDELDKMASAEHAEHFLNEVKGIFGIPHLYFMVSVSDDALNAFERRGFPLRDAFDSSFDEILRVEQLSYSESRRMLYRRVIGLTEPYVALCHCLAGGLARDVIRAARQVVRNAATLIPDGGDEDPGGRESLHAETSNRPLSLSDISEVVLCDELHRKVRALSQVAGHIDSEDTAELQDTLHSIAVRLAPGRPIIDVVDLIARPCHAESAAVARVRLDLAAYAYYCATLQEIFTDRLDEAQMIKATNKSSGHGSFDALATARNTFTTDTLLAWKLITQCREAWSLAIREPVGKKRHDVQPGPRKDHVLHGGLSGGAELAPGATSASRRHADAAGPGSPACSQTGRKRNGQSSPACSAALTTTSTAATCRRRWPPMCTSSIWPSSARRTSTTGSASTPT
jgi:hypothetical protein